MTVPLDIHEKVCKERDELFQKCSDLESKIAILTKGNEILKDSLSKEQKKTGDLMAEALSNQAIMEGMKLTNLTVNHTINRYEHFELPFVLPKDQLSLASDYMSNASEQLVEVLKTSVVTALSEKTDLFEVVQYVLTKVKQLQYGNWYLHIRPAKVD